MARFLTTGLELEDRQYVIISSLNYNSCFQKKYRYQLRYEMSEKKKLRTSEQQADVQEKHNALQRQITNWRQTQLVYTPHAATVLAETDDSHPDLAEDLKLVLPSSLPASIRSLSEMKRICNAEQRLRYTQCFDSLAQIRRQRRIIQGLWQFKRINVSGTGNRPNTRMLTMYNKINRKLARAVHKYQTARIALLVLDPNGDWHEELKELRQEDIRGPGKDPNESKGRYVMSWIWMTRKQDASSLSTEAEFNECMQVEWTKARARMMRWEEEFLILQEEMHRVIAWFEWKATWWEEQRARRTDCGPKILAGVSAYAYKQADLIRRMARRFAEDWLPILASKDIDPAWAIKYPSWKESQKQKVPKDDFEGECEDGEMVEDEGLDFEESRSDVEDDDDNVFLNYDD